VMCHVDSNFISYRVLVSKFDRGFFFHDDY